MKQNQLNELQQLIKNNNATPFDACCAVLQYIFELDETVQEQYFTFFLKNIDFYDYEFEYHISAENTLSSNEIVEELGKNILNVLVERNLTEKVFYQNLWEKLLDPILFTNIESQTSFLVTLWTDVRIPYFHLEKLYSMDDDKYQEVLEELYPHLKKANFILGTQFQQQTELAFLLLKTADEIEDEEKKIVYWSYILSKYREEEIRKYLIMNTFHNNAIQNVEEEDY